MKRILRMLPLLALIVIFATPVIVDAAGGKKKGEIVMKIGSKVHLFHSGRTTAEQEVAIGEVLPVYRQTVKPEQEKEVGQVKVTRFISDHYFEAEITKGDVKVGDIAKKEKKGLLVQPAR